MYLGMRDVLAKAQFPNWESFVNLGLTAMEVRIQPDLSLDSLRGDGLHIRDRQERDNVVAHLAEMGITAKGLLMNTKSDGSEEETEWARATAAFASELGIPSVRFDCHRPDPGTPDAREKLLDQVAPAFEAMLDAAAESGVKLALENHGPFTNRPEVMGALLDRYAERGLSLCLDTGNFYVTGGLPLSEIYDVMERFAPHVTTTHLKNAKYPAELRDTQRDSTVIKYADHAAPIEEGDVDHANVCSILKLAGYDGPLFYEDEYLHHMPDGTDPVQVMQKTIRALQRSLAEFLA